MLSDGTRTHRQVLIDEIQSASLAFLARLRSAESAAFGALGLTYGRAMVLFFVGRGHQTPTALAGLLGVGPTALSALVTWLMAEGLVERLGKDDDGRRVVVQLTDAGLGMLQELERAWSENYPIKLQEFTDEDLATLAAAVHMATQPDFV